MGVAGKGAPERHRPGRQTQDGLHMCVCTYMEVINSTQCWCEKAKSPVRRRGTRAGRDTELSHFPFRASPCRYGPWRRRSSCLSELRGQWGIKPSGKKKNLCPVPFFLSDFHCQDHGVEKRSAVCLSTYY